MMVARALLFAGARADLKDSFGRTPLGVTPRPQCREVERLVCMTARCRQARARARGLASAGRRGGDGVPPVPLARGTAGDKPGSRRDAAEVAPTPGVCAAGVAAVVKAGSCGGGGSQPRPARLRKCPSCGPPLAPSGVGKLQVYGWCSCGRPVHYCPPECEARHWGT